MYRLVSPTVSDDECIKNQENRNSSSENLKGRSPEPPLLHIRTCLKGSQAK